MTTTFNNNSKNQNGVNMNLDLENHKDLHSLTKSPASVSSMRRSPISSQRNRSPMSTSRKSYRSLSTVRTEQIDEQKDDVNVFRSKWTQIYVHDQLFGTQRNKSKTIKKNDQMTDNQDLSKTSTIKKARPEKEENPKKKAERQFNEFFHEIQNKDKEKEIKWMIDIGDHIPTQTEIDSKYNKFLKTRLNEEIYQREQKRSCRNSNCASIFAERKSGIQALVDESLFLSGTPSSTQIVSPRQTNETIISSKDPNLTLKNYSETIEINEIVKNQTANLQNCMQIAHDRIRINETPQLGVDSDFLDEKKKKKKIKRSENSKKEDEDESDDKKLDFKDWKFLPVSVPYFYKLANYSPIPLKPVNDYVEERKIPSLERENKQNNLRDSLSAPAFPTLEVNLMSLK